MNPDAAARYLTHQLKVQAAAMRRRSVAEALIEREIKNMKSAIRREFETNIGAA
jgi:predicted GIY-YIG superfamily endonuclease